jgi:hypothetical protein
MSDKLKNSFYRTLNLDKESKAALKWFRENVKSIKNSAEKKITSIKEDKQ